MPKYPFNTTLRMKQLPKAEYQIMKDLIARYSLNDPSELLAALLRLAAEVEQLTLSASSLGGGSYGIDGASWLLRIVMETRESIAHTPQP